MHLGVDGGPIRSATRVKHRRHRLERVVKSRDVFDVGLRGLLSHYPCIFFDMGCAGARGELEVRRSEHLGVMAQRQASKGSRSFWTPGVKTVQSEF